MSEALRQTIVVAADVDTVLEVVADFAAYPQWQDEVTAVDILATDDDGWATRVGFTVDAGIATTSYVLDYRYDVDGMRWTLESGEHLRRNDGAYRLAEQADGTTLVTYELELETTMPVPAVLWRQVARRIADTALRGLKRRVESAA